MMGIRIESIVVNGLGPISSLQWQFKDINLIYGNAKNGASRTLKRAMAHS